jgi:PKD repeat protein
VLEGQAPLDVAFTLNASDADGSIISYSWDFGDGNTSTSQGPITHQYATAGKYAATVIVTDDGGAKAEDSLKITVTAPTPTVSISASPASIQPEGSSTLTWRSTNAESAAMNNGIGSVAVSGSRTVLPAQTTTYTITVTGGGTTATASVTVTISTGGGGSSSGGIVNQPPAAGLSADVLEGEAPLEVAFTLSASDVGGSIISYSWDFGDGNTSTSQGPMTHEYKNPGTYTAKVVVTDDGGATAQASLEITVTTPQPPGPTPIGQTAGDYNVPPDEEVGLFVKRADNAVREYLAFLGVMDGVSTPVYVLSSARGVITLGQFDPLADRYKYQDDGSTGLILTMGSLGMHAGDQFIYAYAYQNPQGDLLVSHVVVENVQ